MVHYGKDPSGDLLIRVSPDDVGEVYDALQSVGLLQRRTFDALKRYLAEQFADELKTRSRGQTP